MNTPLGIQGKAHQKRRDIFEASLQKRYGVDISAPLASKVKAANRIKSAKDFLESRQSGVKQAQRILKAGR